MEILAIVLRGIAEIIGKSPRQTGGPVVKTGPTAGPNRSRNQDGTWRKMRSDAGTTRSK